MANPASYPTPNYPGNFSLPSQPVGPLATDAPTSSRPASRFGDLCSNPTYAPKSAYNPTKEFEFIYRNSLEGGIFLRFVSHPVLLPNGFHYLTYHKVPQPGSAAPIKIQCTESYNPSEPCYTCELIKDLDDYANNRNDSILSPEILGQNLFNVLVQNSTMYCRSVLMPAIIQGQLVTVPGREDPSKSYKSIVPKPGSYCTGLLTLSPDKPHEKFGSFPDKSFYRKLQLMTLSDADVMEQYQRIAFSNPTEAQKFYAEASGIHRNPNLFDIQNGSWVAYNKGSRGVPATLGCQPPSPLSQDLVSKYLTEDVYPNVRHFGAGGAMTDSARKSWTESMQAWKYSWVGQELQSRHGWDMDLVREDYLADDGIPF